MTPIYKISRWQDVFETAESKRYKTLTWVSMPIGFTSNGYQSLVEEFENEAPAIYGAWCALVAIAADCAVRGTLATSKGDPLPIHRIARMCYMPVEVFEKLFKWASSESVGWLEVEHHPAATQQLPNRHPADTQQSNSNSCENVELPNLTQHNLTEPIFSAVAEPPLDPPQKKTTKKKPAKEKQPPKPREPDPLFDAIAEVSGSDPKASGGHVAKVRKALSQAEPPYTPEEVHDFARNLKLFCPWVQNDKPGLGLIEKYIGLVRNRPKAQPPPGDRKGDAAKNAFRLAGEAWQQAEADKILQQATERQRLRELQDDQSRKPFPAISGRSETGTSQTLDAEF